MSYAVGDQTNPAAGVIHPADWLDGFAEITDGSGSGADTKTLISAPAAGVRACLTLIHVSNQSAVDGYVSLLCAGVERFRLAVAFWRDARAAAAAAGLDVRAWLRRRLRKRAAKRATFT